MYWALGIGIYLLIGAIYSILIFIYLDNKIEDYESGGYLDEDDIRLLEENSQLAKQMGSTGYTAFMFALCTVGWLPMLIFTPTNK